MLSVSSQQPEPPGSGIVGSFSLLIIGDHHHDFPFGSDVLKLCNVYYFELRGLISKYVIHDGTVCNTLSYYFIDINHKNIPLLSINSVERDWIQSDIYIKSNN